MKSWFLHCAWPCSNTTPTALDGAHQLVLEGARHVPIEAKPQQGIHWYGSGRYLQQWVDWLQEEEAGLVARASSLSAVPPTAATKVDASSQALQD